MRISDWSSDVCSSDLAGNQLGQEIHHILRQDLRIVYDQHRPSGAVAGELCKPVLGRDRITRALPSQSRSATRGLKQIGRASCWARVCQYVLISVVAVFLKTKTNKNRKNTEQGL